jgi:hypothetical protein
MAVGGASVARPARLPLRNRVRSTRDASHVRGPAVADRRKAGGPGGAGAASAFWRIATASVRRSRRPACQRLGREGGARRSEPAAHVEERKGGQLREHPRRGSPRARAAPQQPTTATRRRARVAQLMGSMTRTACRPPAVRSIPRRSRFRRGPPARWGGPRDAISQRTALFRPPRSEVRRSRGTRPQLGDDVSRDEDALQTGCLSAARALREPRPKVSSHAVVADGDRGNRPICPEETTRSGARQGADREDWPPRARLRRRWRLDRCGLSRLGRLVPSVTVLGDARPRSEGPVLRTASGGTPLHSHWFHLRPPTSTRRSSGRRTPFRTSRSTGPGRTSSATTGRGQPVPTRPRRRG